MSPSCLVVFVWCTVTFERGNQRNSFTIGTFFADWWKSRWNNDDQSLHLHCVLRRFSLPLPATGTTCQKTLILDQSGPIPALSAGMGPDPAETAGMGPDRSSYYRLLHGYYHGVIMPVGVAVIIFMMLLVVVVVVLLFYSLFHLCQVALVTCQAVIVGGIRS